MNGKYTAAPGFVGAPGGGGVPGGGTLEDFIDLIAQAIVIDDTGLVVTDDQSETVIADVEEI